MNFDFDDDQREIKRTAHDLLASRSSWERVREAAESGVYDATLWAELSELGWPGIAIAEEHGGQGLGLVELCVLLEELGYAGTATPLLSTALAAVAIQEAGSPEQREAWLPRLASGEITGTLGLAASGVGELVPDAGDAAVIVLVEDGAGRLLTPQTATIEPVAAIDPTRHFARVTATGGEELPGDIGAALDKAAVAVSAELVGVCQRALDMSVEYAKDRKQFDTPVGAFQAVAHKCAQMLKYTEGARAAAYAGAWAADASGLEGVDLAESASIAKAAASEAGREVTASAIQVHGGIGFTWEADVHWLFKRAQLDAAYLGGAGAHRRRLTALLASRLTTAAR